VWRADHPTQSISYDDWKTSHHVAGLSLFFAAADIFNESASSVSFFFSLFFFSFLLGNRRGNEFPRPDF